MLFQGGIGEVDPAHLRFPVINDEDADLSDPLWLWVHELEPEYRKKVLAVATVRQAILEEREWALGYLQLREGWLDEIGRAHV